MNLGLSGGPSHTVGHVPSWKRRAAPYAILIALTFVLFGALTTLPSRRVGDGAEYYGMFLAWKTTHRPWMTNKSYAAYGRLTASHKITGMVPTKKLRNSFPALHVHHTFDFNHFWVYSLLAYAVGAPFAAIGLPLTIQQHFLLLHVLLLFITTIIAFRYYRWRGAAVVASLIFLSPMFWYLDKVHTELFTFSVVLSAVLFFGVKRYFWAGFFLGLAATQNPSFAIVACVPIVMRLWYGRHTPYRFIHLVLIVATSILLIAQPAYYFVRYGVVNPQFLGHNGAMLGDHLSRFYIWLIGPDLGLVPNWLLLVVAIAFAAFLAVKSKGKVNIARAWGPRWVTFLLIYVAVGLYAASSTTNLNSGGTPGLSRYATWYIPLAFPYFYALIAVTKLKSIRMVFVAGTVLACIITTLIRFNPAEGEEYTAPTPVSYFIQSRMPWLYDPPPEVFQERYSGYDEIHADRLSGVVGPDCRKLLINPAAANRGVAIPHGCLLDSEMLSRYVSNVKIGHASSFYARLSPTQTSSLRFRLAYGTTYLFGIGRRGNVLLGEGWSVPESWGIWSDQTNATIVLPCDAAPTLRQRISVSITLRPFRKQRLDIRAGTRSVWRGAVPTDGRISFTVPKNNCVDDRSRIQMYIPNAVSPAALHISSDTRRLGIGIMSIRVDNLISSGSTSGAHDFGGGRLYSSHHL